jgi:hypothetical protein
VIRYYDKDGKPITLTQWGQLSEFPKYRFIASDTIGTMWLSTIWLGLDHALHFFDDAGPPLIFETCLFVVPQGDDRWTTLEMERYSTIEQAREGHARLLGLAREIESLKQTEGERDEDARVVREVPQDPHGHGSTGDSGSGGPDRDLR